jgi:selenocysteine lyase/cysteine desulfurase
MDPLVPRESYAALEQGVYLNQASLGLVPREATEAMVRFQVDVAQHGNVRMSDAQETTVLDGLRRTAAGFLDAPEGSVAVVGGASEALGQLAALLATPDAEVVLVRTDFPSVTYPWLGARDRLGTRVRWVDDDPAADLTERVLGAVHGGTSVVCVSAVQYATGSLVDVAAVARAAHRVGATVVVDATQLAGAGPVSVRGWDADAVVCSGYKWLSGHGGVALLVVDEVLAARTPHILGWKGAPDPFDFRADRLTLAPDARRFELSTMAYGSALALTSSLDLLGGVGPDRIAAHADVLARELVSRVAPLGWQPYRPLGSGSAGHLVSLRHRSLPAADVQRQLAERGVVVSPRGGALRVSLHVYNGSDDLAALVGTLREL